MGKRTGQLKLGTMMHSTGMHMGAWRHPDANPEYVLDPNYYKDLVQIAERGKFDMVFMADTLAFGLEGARVSHMGLKLEPLTLLASIAAVTSKIGLASTTSTTYNEPYQVASDFASLDHLSGGRAAWNVVTSILDLEAQNFSKEKHMEHGDRYERAREFVEVAAKLWESWDKEALIADKDAGVYLDEKQVHNANHQGASFSVEGPLNAPRPPQGWPVLIQAGASEVGQDFAAEIADVIFTAQLSFESAQAFYRSVKSKLANYGRSPDEIKVLPGIIPIIGKTVEDAKLKYEELNDLIDPGLGITALSHMFKVDLSAYPIDGPLPELSMETNAIKSMAQLYKDMSTAEGLSIRQLGQRMVATRGHIQFIGTAEQFADLAEKWFNEEACDGFNIVPYMLPRGLHEFVDEVVPILQQRGLFRTEYTGNTLREHLGLGNPVNRFKHAHLGGKSS